MNLKNVLGAALADALTRVGVNHRFETYEGDHGNRIAARFGAKVLPFFSENLTEAGRQSQP
jgi:hypothetical protein